MRLPNPLKEVIMNRWIKRSLFGLVGGALITSSVIGCAAQSWRTGDSTDMRAKMVERIGSKLELDASQQQRLATLASKLEAQRQAMRASGDARSQFQALLAGNKLDQAGAAKLIDEKTDAVRNGSPEVIAAAADFFDNLNPTQQQKVRDFMSKGRRFGHRG
jgi:protein CpxP